MGWVDPFGLSCKEVIPDNYDPLEDLYKPPLNPEQAIHNRQRTARDVVFAGHGSLNPAKMVTIPEGTSLTVYSYPGATISDPLGQLIEKGQSPNNIYKKTFFPGDKIPELFLHPNCGSLNLEDSSCQTKQIVSIEDLLVPNMGNCHWAACTYVDSSHKNAKLMHHTDGIHYIDKTAGVHKKYVDGTWVDV